MGIISQVGKRISYAVFWFSKGYLYTLPGELYFCTMAVLLFRWGPFVTVYRLQQRMLFFPHYSKLSFVSQITFVKFKPLPPPVCSASGRSPPPGGGESIGATNQASLDLL